MEKFYTPTCDFTYKDFVDDSSIEEVIKISDKESYIVHQTEECDKRRYTSLERCGDDEVYSLEELKNTFKRIVEDKYKEKLLEIEKQKQKDLNKIDSDEFIESRLDDFSLKNLLVYFPCFGGRFDIKYINEYTVFIYNTDKLDTNSHLGILITHYNTKNKFTLCTYNINQKHLVNVLSEDTVASDESYKTLIQYYKLIGII